MSQRLIIKLLKKIIDNPQDTKYQTLNYDMVRNKLQNKESMNLLYNAGFYKSENGKKLLFNIECMDTMKMFHAELTSS